MNILITGGNGYIAQSLYNGLKDFYSITTVNRSVFDLVDGEQTNKWFSGKYFDLVIHTAINGGNRLQLETSSVLDNNLQMYYNLLSNKNHYGRFISFGSGAELYSTNTFYGLSKHVIRKSILEKDNFYNIRIFAVFDENELDRRFIKSNIIRYINKEPMIIHQDKKMDFFYIKDLVKVVKYYIQNDNLPKEFNCTYAESFLLSQIAEKINRLSDHTVEIQVQSSQNSNDYIGTVIPIETEFIGFDKAIKNVYQTLICKI